MTNALEVLGDALRLTPLEHRFARAILEGSPVAREGAPALIPIQDLCTVLEADAGQMDAPAGGGTGDAALRERAAECLAGLLRSPRTLVSANEKTTLILFVLARVELGSTTVFAQCQFDGRFLALLRNVAAERGLDLY
ncbi:hypothetical protein [Pararobbsia silviterrae]|uniref:Uncharacterized protein n=1 Tax=Pararobbsia silviterrae TaxID=1792498 RepID=A0A494XM76_9BURK|nr:hypothetical protein [Pararobbsia silviterrae]RKP51805.1 hypothetical protein D7S86_17770 [Pararobbsia silviterrae]